MRNSGQSLFEVVIAIAISALIIVSIVSLTTNSIYNSSYSRDKALAASYVQEASEWLRGQRDSDISAFVTHTESDTWCLKDLSWNNLGSCKNTDYIANTKFIRQATFRITTVNSKNIIESNVKVSWQDSKGSHDVTSSTNLTDWRQH